MISDKYSPMADQSPRFEPRKWLLVATAILLFAAAFRLVALNAVPPGLAQDEVLDADIALFIRQGENALFFRHGYGHEPLYHYWAAFYQTLYGDNILSVRLPAAYLGMFLVALTLRWAKRDFGSVAATVAGLGLAISWWPIIFSRIGIRPIMEPVFLVGAMWFWPLREGSISRQALISSVVSGALLGLSIYTYTAARIILLLPLILFLLFAFQGLLARWAKTASRLDGRMLRSQVIYSAVVLIAALMVYLPLGLTLRANPELQQRIQQLEGPLVALREGDIDPVVGMSVATLGVFSQTGDPRWTYSLPGRPLFDPFTATLFYAGLFLAIYRWRRPHYALLPIWLIVALLPSALSPDAPSTVRLVGAMPVVFLLPGVAVDALVRWVDSRAGSRMRWKKYSWGSMLAGIVGIILIVNSYRTVRDGFILWPANLETRLRYQSTLRDMARYWVANDDPDAPVIAEVFFEPIDEASLNRNAGKPTAARWVQTGAGVSGAMVWPGDWNSKEGIIYVPEYAPPSADLTSVSGLNPEPVFRSAGLPSFAAYALPPEPAIEFEPISASFSSPESGVPLAKLEGIHVLESRATNIKLASYWQVREPLPEDLAIFVHVVDVSGNLVAQHDGLDAAAITLKPGDMVLQLHNLAIPGEIESGQFQVWIGLYRRSDGTRFFWQNRSDSLPVLVCGPNELNQEQLECRLTDPK